MRCHALERVNLLQCKKVTDAATFRLVSGFKGRAAMPELVLFQLQIRFF